MYREFRANVLKLHQVSQLGINAIQTQLFKSDCSQARLRKLESAVERALGQTAQQSEVEYTTFGHTKIYQMPKSKIGGRFLLFDEILDRSPQYTQFKPTINGSVRVDFNLDPEVEQELELLGKKQLETDIDKYQKTQLELLQTNQQMQ